MNTNKSEPRTGGNAGGVEYTPDLDEIPESMLAGSGEPKCAHGIKMSAPPYTEDEARCPCCHHALPLAKTDRPCRFCKPADLEADGGEDEGEDAYLSVDGMLTNQPAWMICPDCDGEGTHVNDALSAPSSEMMEDEDFREQYFRGGYDVKCARCEGSGKVHKDRDPGHSRARTRAGRLVNDAGEPLEWF